MGEDQIIHMGIIKHCLLMAESSSRRQRIAPVPRGVEALSSTLNAEISYSLGEVLFIISSGCSSPSLSITISISLESLSR